MLTKTDLQAINKIVKAGNDNLRQELKSASDALRQEIKTENETLRAELKKEMKKGFKRIERKLDYAINFLDRDYLKLLQRVERIEKHLGLEPVSL